MATHRQPESGYKSDEKQQYRERVWMSFSDTWSISMANKNKNGFILIMPGLTCDEIDTAVKYGINPDKIICVHESAAHVAKSADWRKKYPNTPFYCCKISELRNKLIRDSRYLVGANFDFCNNLSGELIEELDAILHPSVIHPIFNFQVNMMKGRESKTITSVMKILKKRQGFCYNSKKERMPNVKDLRLTALLDLIGLYERFGSNSFRVIHEDSYVNNKVPMVHCSVSLMNDMWFHMKNDDDRFLCETSYAVNDLVCDEIKSAINETQPSNGSPIGQVKLDLLSIQSEAEFVCEFLKQIEYTAIDEIKRSKLYLKSISDFDKPKNRHHAWYKGVIESGELREVAEKYLIVSSIFRKIESDDNLTKFANSYAKKQFNAQFTRNEYLLRNLISPEISRIVNPNDFRAMTIGELLRVYN